MKNDEEKNEIRENFDEQVNMSPAELNEWLKTEESKSVGQKSDEGETLLGTNQAKK